MPPEPPDGAGGEPPEGERDDTPVATTTDGMRHMQVATGHAPGDRLPYVPGLDGLRALAVIAVMLYHADFGWMQGGFLGVEVFFVISGYLITSLLLREHERDGRVDLRRFWTRRARRLLPALFTLLLVVGVVATVFVRDSIYRLGRDSLAATGYVTNWYLIGTENSYFESFGRPPMLQHLWSLSVEEQFYVLWPLAFVVGLALLGRRVSRRHASARMVVLLACGIAISTALMWLWFVPYEDPSRIYYGTDTRAAGLLVGAVLAFAWRPWRFRIGLPTGAKVGMNIVGFSALGLLIALNMNVSEFGPFLYRGGFLVVALTTAAVIAVVVHPEAAVGAALSARVLRWIGTRSYGIYLWHWPVFAVTRPGIDIELGTVSAFVVRVIVTLVLAELSYRLVEAPIRRLGFGGWLRSLGDRFQPVPAAGWVGATATLAVVALVVSGLVIGAGAPQDGAEVLASPLSQAVAMPRASAAEGSSTAALGRPVPLSEEDRVAVYESKPIAIDGEVSAEGPAPDPDPAAAPESTDAGGDVAALGETTPEPFAAEGEPIPTPRHNVTLLIGDSVMLGASDALRETLGPDIVLDAEVSRQMKQSPDVVGAARDAEPAIDTVVIHLGTNGAFNADTFDRLMEQLDGVDRIVFINAGVPRRWEEVVNAALADGVERWGTATLIDWSSIASERPELLQEDHVHLNAEGQQVYASLVAEAVGQDEEPPPEDPG